MSHRPVLARPTIRKTATSEAPPYQGMGRGITSERLRVRVADSIVTLPSGAWDALKSEEAWRRARLT